MTTSIRNPHRGVLAPFVTLAAASALLTACASTGTSGSSSASAPTGTAAGSSATASTGSTTGAGAASASPAAGTATTGGSSTGATSPTPSGATTTSAPAAPVTSGTPVPEHGSGSTTPVEVPGKDSGAKGRTVRYSVEIEGGLEPLAVGFPEAVRSTLTDPRGWEAEDGVHFVHVSPRQQKNGARVDVHIMFASPDLVDRRCAPMRTNGRLSCHHNGNVMVNAWRWVNGADTYGTDLADYRLYLVNHEVGHSIGHPHKSCPAPGRPAPVMLQQTKELDGCRPHPWPAGA